MGYKGRTKYNNKKVEYEGKKFDSKLELYMYRALKSYGIEFEFQVEIELIPKIPEVIMPWGARMRRTFMRVDFVVKMNDMVYYIDTKGFATDVSKLKYKMLAHKKHLEDADFKIIWLKTQKQVLEFVNNLKKEKDE